jgi:peroxiredoxin
MRLSLLLLTLLVTATAWCGDVTPLNAEDRKKEYAALQKELEATRPIEGATREEVLAYLELLIEKYGKFARDNPQTAEGFEAASTVALMLAQSRHKDALKYAELAVAAAPKSGVDVKRVALCWAMIADGRLQKEDAVGAREAIEKVKPLDEAMYKQLAGQFAEAEKQLAGVREAKERLQVGKEPFPIEEKDIAGKAVSLAALKGKVVLVDFWAPWCGPCMEEMPNVAKLYKEQHQRGFEIIGVSLDKDEESLQGAIKEQGIAWPILSDHAFWQNAIARKWGIRSIPTTYLLDRKGLIRNINVRADDLAKAVQKLLDEQ